MDREPGRGTASREVAADSADGQASRPDLKVAPANRRGGSAGALYGTCWILKLVDEVSGAITLARVRI